MIPSQHFIQFPISPTNVLISPKIRQTIAYLNMNYARDITLKDVALCFRIHPTYLCRRFKKDLGVSFHEYLLRRRVEIACLLLRNSVKSIKEISYETGFCRPEIFSKAFKRLIGCSPRDYRASNLSTVEKLEDVPTF